MSKIYILKRNIVDVREELETKRAEFEKHERNIEKLFLRKVKEMAVESG